MNRIMKAARRIGSLFLISCLALLMSFFTITSAHAEEESTTRDISITTIATSAALAQRSTESNIFPTQKVNIYVNDEVVKYYYLYGFDNGVTTTWTVPDIPDAEYKVEVVNVTPIWDFPYTVTISGNADEGFTVLFDYEISSSQKSVTTTWIWNDSNNADQLRPSANGAGTISYTENGEPMTYYIEGTWKNNQDSTLTRNDILDNVADASAIEIFVEDIEGYVIDVTGNAEEGFVITATHEVASLTKTVTIQFEDENNKYGVRPDSGTVSVYIVNASSGSRTLFSSTAITAENNWTVEYCVPAEINYSVNIDINNYLKYKEKDGTLIYIPNYNSILGYATAYINFGTSFVSSSDLFNATTVVSSYDRLGGPDQKEGYQTLCLNMTAEKAWTWPKHSTASTMYQKIPASADVLEYSLWENASDTVVNGRDVNFAKGLNDKNSLAATQARYSSEETYAGVMKAVYGGMGGVFNLAEKYGLTANEVRMASQAAVWYYTDSYEILASDLGDNGEQIAEAARYIIDHAPISESVLASFEDIYIMRAQDNGGNGLGIGEQAHTQSLITVPTNTKISISGEKTWDDENNKDGIRPESIIINLTGTNEEGTVVVEKSAEVTADENDKWYYSFTELSPYIDGQEVTYTVSEDEIEGYTTTVDGYNITNIHNTNIIVSGEKTWDDEDNKDGIRPESITIHLTGTNEDGNIVVEKSSEVYADENNSWIYSFENLSPYIDGQKITYILSEEAVEGYTTEIDGYNISNIHTPKDETPASETLTLSATPTSTSSTTIQVTTGNTSGGSTTVKVAKAAIVPNTSDQSNITRWTVLFIGSFIAIVIAGYELLHNRKSY